MLTPSDLQARLQTAIGDRYAIDRELAPGGMSRLFLATERSLDRRVVIKLLPPEFANEATAQRFQREMLVTAKLQHAHILPVLSAGAHQDLLYYLMPYVDGESLRQRLAHGPLPTDEAIRLLREIGDGLAFAHARGVVHRDLKPENILLQHGHALLADFGIARALDETSRATATGFGLGTIGYMAPEQLAADPAVDARADIYALGIIAYEMLAGRPPFPGLSRSELVVAHMTRAPEPLITHGLAVPVSLAALVMRCLEKEPDARWQTTSEMVGMLENVALPMPFASPTPQPSNAVGLGLAAFDRCDWRAAYDALSAADTERTAGALTPAQLERFAEAAWWIGRGDECIRVRERAYAEYLAAGNIERAAAMAVAVAEDHFHKLSRAVGHGWLQRAERHLAGLPEGLPHGWMARTRSMMAFEGDRDFARAEALAEEARAIAERLGDRDLQTLALQDRGRILVAQGRVAEGMALIDEAMAAATSGQLGPRTTGRTYCNMMSTCEKMADYRRAGEWNEAARQWCTNHAQSGFPGICRIHRAELLRLRGAWPEAEQEARRASAELEDFLSDIAGDAYYEMGEIRRRMGDWDAADDFFRRAHALGRDPLPGLALLRLAQGRADSAHALLERALSDPLLSALDRMRLLPARAEVALATGALDAARATAAECASVAETYGSPALAANAAFARGLLEFGESQPTQAAASLRRAWKLWKDTDLPYEAARARMFLGRAYRASGNSDDADLELKAAAASFERLGATADLRSCGA